jgi:type I restriction enzyme R subunit
MPTEADTCRTYIVPKLHAAGWEDDFIAEQRVIAPGRIVPLGRKHTQQASRRPDYILFLRRNYPIAVVEAKAEYKNLADGLQGQVDALKALQSQTQAELDALLPSVLDKAFKGEL